MSETRLRRSDPGRERYWRELVQGQQQSGRSVRAYCRDAGVKESAFYWWRRELVRRSQAGKLARSRPASRRKAARSSSPQEPARPRESRPGRKPRRAKPSPATSLGGGPCAGDASSFVPIEVLASKSTADPGGVEIHLGDGRMICVRRGFHRQTLSDVLAVLEGRPC